jgi:hypothetical protein
MAVTPSLCADFCLLKRNTLPKARFVAKPGVCAAQCNPFNG